MPLSPEDVEQQVFKEKIRGYDMEEVDAFLDRVVERMRELEAERDRLAHDVQAAATSGAGGGGEDADLLRRTLVTAQRAADQTLSEAREEAERVLSEARFEAAREREQLQEEAEQLAGAVEDLKRFRQDYVERVRGVITDHLRVLEERGLPAFPEEAAEVARQAAAAGGGSEHAGREAAPRSALDTDEDAADVGSPGDY